MNQILKYTKLICLLFLVVFLVGCGDDSGSDEPEKPLSFMEKAVATISIPEQITNNIEYIKSFEWRLK